MNSDPEKFNFKEYRIRVLTTFKYYYDVIEYRIRHTGKKKASPSSAVYMQKVLLNEPEYPLALEQQM